MQADVIRYRAGCFRPAHIRDTFETIEKYAVIKQSLKK